MAAPETTKFIHSLQLHPDKVDDAISAVLKEKKIVPFTEPQTVIDSMGLNIDHYSTPDVLPPWMNQKGLYTAVGEISASPVWQTLLSEVNPTMQEKVTAELRNGDPAKLIALSNARFLTSALTLGLLATATGNSIAKCINTDRSQLDTTFALQIGATYENPPSDINEYMTRVDELLPNPETTSADEEGTLFTYLTNHHTFKSPHSGSRCPAAYFTRLMLESWGRQLHTDDIYRERFKRRITN